MEAGAIDERERQFAGDVIEWQVQKRQVVQVGDDSGKKVSGELVGGEVEGVERRRRAGGEGGWEGTGELVGREIEVVKSGAE